MSLPEKMHAAEALLTAAAEGVYIINPEELGDLSNRLVLRLVRAGEVLGKEEPGVRHATEFALRNNHTLAVLGQKTPGGVRTEITIGSTPAVREKIDDHMRHRDK